MPRPRWVTLTTDIGSVYAAQMKAVLFRSVPPERVVEISHEVAPHQIAEAAFLLEHIGPQFPAGTVHVAVVDPGVGGPRAPLAIACRDGSRLVGPDNGVLAPLARRLGGGSAVRLDPRRVGSPSRRSATFDGRDLFAPAAARLARGAAWRGLGGPTPFRALAAPAPVRTVGRLQGRVVHLDRFGNVITNLPTPWWPRSVRAGQLAIGRRRRAVRRVRTYGDLARHEVGLLGSSFGTLEVCQREGRASDLVGARVGEPLVLRSRSFGPPPARRRSGAR
jgi:S-adenosylmethionine hydrolase